jgi:hypothetical protein
MHEQINARSGDGNLAANLDFESLRWTSTSEPPEGDFPFVGQLNGKRYELYSDGTFAEVERGP